MRRARELEWESISYGDIPMRRKLPSWIFDPVTFDSAFFYSILISDVGSDCPKVVI